MTYGGGVVPTSIFLFLTMYSPSDIDFDRYDEPRLHMERLMRVHLTEFDISIRILLPLESAGITRLGHLVKQSRKSLLNIPQFGITSLRKIEAFLDYHGLSLSPE